MSVVAVVESIKPDELRLPVYPNHIKRLIRNSVNRVIFQDGYGQQAGLTKEDILASGFEVGSRDLLLAMANIAVILKPEMQDLELIKPGATIIGWCHCVQRQKFTKLAVSKDLTLIALEDMFVQRGGYLRHVFSTNNFIAGQVSVLHALSLVAPQDIAGATSACVIGYGCVGVGAARALARLGFDVDIFSRRAGKELERASVARCIYRMRKSYDGDLLYDTGDKLSEKILEYPVIVNAIKQDVLDPWVFLTREQVEACQAQMVIIDISCDEHMGFDFAVPTSYQQPLRAIGNAMYYSIDNAPSLVWQLASKAVSINLIPYLNHIIAGSNQESVHGVVLHRALQVKKGRIVNPIIDSYAAYLSNAHYSFV